VAYSGGVDSALVLHAACQSLGCRQVVAITADSPSLARSELEDARAFTRSLGVLHLVAATSELSNPDYARNDAQRCYHCKHTFYGTAIREAAAFFSANDDYEADGAPNGRTALVDGTNADDFCDTRPGLRAAEQAQVKHPLADCGIGKQQVRQLSRHCGLPMWNKPAMACLASRIEQSTCVTKENLAMVEQAEAALRRLGCAGVRVRYHQLGRAGADSGADSHGSGLTLARVELAEQDLAQAGSAVWREKAVAAVKEAGFSYVALDLEGYKRGGKPREA